MIWLLGSIGDFSFADNNFLTGANDIIAVVDEDGDIKASPFNVQFGKKDIWLPRAGHVVSLEVNKVAVPVGMVLDSAGQVGPNEGFLPLTNDAPGHQAIVTPDDRNRVKCVVTRLFRPISRPSKKKDPATDNTGFGQPS